MDDRGGGKFGNQSGSQDGSANGASANQGGISVPDFLPPAQRVLFMRIQQKQQEEEERARRMAEGGAEKTRDTEGELFMVFTMKTTLTVAGGVTDLFHMF